MAKETILVEKGLYENLVKENIRLRAELELYKQKEFIQTQPMEKQISIDEWQKTLKKGNNNGKRDNGGNK